MSLPDVRNIFRTPGRLSFGATNLSIAFPHGGTAFGVIGSKVLKPFSTKYVVTAEEFGGEPIDELKTAFSFVLSCTLREFDSDIIQRVFPNTLVGTSGNRVVQHPQTGPQGSILTSDRSLSNLVFTPDDQQRHVGFIFYRALPEIDDAAELTFALNENMEIALIFTAIRDTSNRAFQFGLLSDLSL